MEKRLKKESGSKMNKVILAIEAFIAKYKKISKYHYYPLVFIMLLCIIFRIIYFSHLQPYTIGADTDSYVNAIDSVLQGKVDRLRLPLYPLFLGFMRSLFNEGYMLAAVNAQTVMALVSIVFFYFTVGNIFKNKNITYCATIFYGILPQILNWERILIPESLAISGTVFFFYIVMRYLKKPAKKTAFLIGILCFLFVMLKPAFVIYSVIILFFWICRFIFQRQELKQNVIGVISVLAVFLLLRGYCLLNERDNAYDGISIVGTNLNQVFMLMDNNMYRNPAYPDIENKIDELMNSPQYTITWDRMMALNSEVEPQLLTEYANATVKYHIRDFTYYSLKKFALLAKEPISVGEFAGRINTHWEVITDSVMLFLFPLTFLHLYALVFLELIFAVRHFLKYKEVPWISLGLAAFILGQTVVAVVGAMSDWQRLIVNVFPLILTLFFLDIDRLICFVQGRALQKKNE